MAQPVDKQIFWVVLISLGFWAGIWKHEAVVEWARKALNLAISLTPR